MFLIVIFYSVEEFCLESVRLNEEIYFSGASSSIECFIAYVVLLMECCVVRFLSLTESGVGLIVDEATPIFGLYLCRVSGFHNGFFFSSFYS